MKERRAGQLLVTNLIRPVYEYRSGRLIEGIIDDDNGNFIPALDTRAIDFKAYRYSKHAIPIYNLPGHFVKKGERKEDPGKD